MGETKTRINNLSGNIRDYIETRIDIIKLEAADTGSSAVSSLASFLLIGIIGLVMLIILSVGLSIGIGYLLENQAAGFLIMAGVYLVTMIILYSNRENWIRKPLINSIIKNIYHE
jgi:hypothetical protein